MIFIGRNSVGEGGKGSFHPSTGLMSLMQRKIDHAVRLDFEPVNDLVMVL